jgi:phosphoglycerol transferase MdoB-like AlkP superfamily enzyme
VVLTNLPFWAASRWLGLLPIGWFCIEYAVVGLLALFLPRALTALLLLLVIVADIICGVSKTYYLAPSQCFANLGAVHNLPGSRMIALTAVVALTMCVVAIAFFFPAKKIKGSCKAAAATCFVAFSIIVMAVDLVSIRQETGQMPHPFHFAPQDARNLSYFNTEWAARYPAIRLIRDQMALGDHWAHTVSALDQTSVIASASDAIVRSAGFELAQRPQKLPNIVVVLTESWGISTDAVVRDGLVHPYFQPGLLGQYTVTQGTVPFYGPTIGGEARELCRSKIGMQIVNVPSQGFKTCLPMRLAALGYRSIALHGMEGNMFHRSTWYRRIGFHEQWFHSDFKQQEMRDCLGAFTGTCDAAVADWIGRRLGVKSASPDAGPTFAYWVTLNSHLPVPVPSALPNPASCSLTPMLSERPALCSWYQLIANVHDSVARLAMSNLARPTVFVIVGDHAPPFSDAALRGQFSSTDVPYVVLSPRQDVHPAAQTAKAQRAELLRKPS